VYVLAESKEGTLFRSTDHGETFVEVNRDPNIVNRGFYYTQLRVDPTNEDRVYAIAGNLQTSGDGGKTFKRISRSTHVDFHTLWIDPKDPARMWQGEDGGLAVSYDRGEKWEYVDNVPLGQFYQIVADDREPFYFLGGGLQDNGTWWGPSRTREPFGILNDDWRMVSFGDGFFIAAHPETPDLFLSESQGGGIVRTDMKTRESQDASPQPRRNDGGPVRDLKYRFNWNSPIVASPHDGKVVYFAGNVVFRSPDFGLHWEAISPDLTTNDPEKLGVAGGPVFTENTTAEYHCTIISFAESPAEKGVLWAGTDDGKLQVSRDAGKTWTSVAPAVPGLKPFSPVSHVEPSRTAGGTAYAAFERHMFDDFRPYLFKTTDYGKTWTSVAGDLPARAYLQVVREDPKNPKLLYAGTEIGLFASWDTGRSWTKLHLKNLPPVSVHDILVHSRDNDLVLATHGRALYVLDDATPVQQAAPDVLAKPLHLFPARPALRFAQKPTRYGLGDKKFRGENPAYGALVTFSLKEKPAKDAPVRLEVLDAAGTVVREIKKVPAEPGLNRVAWDLRYDPPRARKEAEKKEGEGEEEEEEFGPGNRGPQALPGTYRLRLTVGGQAAETPVEVRLDPTQSATAADLRIQFDDAIRLREMRSALNDGLRGLDRVKREIDDRGKLLGEKKDAPEAAKTTFKTRAAELDRLLDRLAKPEGKPFWSEGPRLAERLGGLAGGIDGGNKAPTAPERELLGELRTELAKAREDSARFLAEALPEMNRVLAAQDLPPVGVPRPFDLPSAQP
jgi:photosystem II stability/assembly factor-like uncharacterized protein